MGQRVRRRERAGLWGICIGVMALLASGVTAGPALASVSGTDGPGGTVSVGASDGGSSSGSSGSAGTGRPDGSGGGKGGANGTAGGSPWVCTYTSLLLNDEGGFAPGGPTPGGWYSVTCINRVSGASTTQTEWIPSQATAAPPASAAVPAVAPRVLALEAENSLRLPAPTLRFNPTASSVVNLPTWLWVDPSIWHQLSVTASAGTVSATAVATPEMVTWQMGDGGRVLCNGPGRPFDRILPAQRQVTGCDYTYRTSSLGQPSPDGRPDDAAYPVRATITWSVSWTATGAPGQGLLPPLGTTAGAAVRVLQVESINSVPFDPSGPHAAHWPRTPGGVPW